MYSDENVSRTARVGLACLALFAAACGNTDGPEVTATLQELMDPESCRDCHPDAYREWSGSMHAYAADDPMFIAMNARGQRETNGELGDFCVNCHAPMAVRTGATTDGLNIQELPQHLKGVTCFFCHSVLDVEGQHNNPLGLAEDGVLRGGIPDPVENGFHAMAYSPLLDRQNQESSKLCGPCHDIVTPAGVHLERTYLEWQESIFASESPQQHLSCGRCHLNGRDGVAADFEGVPLRRVHDHSMASVDVALTPWPEMEAQREAIDFIWRPAIKPRLCVQPDAGGVKIEYILDNVTGGHMIPSGAAAERRMWAEIRVEDTDGASIYESGVVEDGQPVVDAAASDPDLWEIRDFATKASGDVAHMFWDVREVDSRLLPPAVTNDPTDPRFDHSVTRDYSLLGIAPSSVGRVTAIANLRPVGLDVVDDLVDSGDLDPVIRERIVTFVLDGTRLEWTADDGFGCVPE